MRAATTTLQAAKTLGALLLLEAALPVSLALTGAALLRSLVVTPARSTAAQPRTVLLSGGKMTKALQLARSFHAAGHRVVMVESAAHRTTGHRFSRAVDSFHVVPPPTDPGYARALLEVVRAERVDVFVPVSSPVSSLYDALAAPLLEPWCEVLHCDAEMIRTLDDKHAFGELATSLGLPVPDAHRITRSEQVAAVETGGREYVLKSIPYDPVNRLDLTPLPRPTALETARFVRSKAVSPQSPWVLQELVRGTEYCTHSTVRDGHIQVWCCCESSAFQVNYASVDKPEIEAWVRAFVGPLGLTGQVSLDVMQTADGRVLPIECNPRTHSAITMFHDHPDLARAYLEHDVPTVTPLPGSRPTYWVAHELWRMLSSPRQVPERMRVLLDGKDAVFAWDDPLPFLVLHHLHIPTLLLRNLWQGRGWIRIDFNIGKLVQAAGD